MVFVLLFFRSDLQLLRFYMPLYCSRMSQGIIRLDIYLVKFIQYFSEDYEPEKADLLYQIYFCFIFVIKKAYILTQHCPFFF